MSKLKWIAVSALFVALVATTVIVSLKSKPKPCDDLLRQEFFTCDMSKENMK